MKKIIVLLFVCLFLSVTVYAQFNPSAIRNAVKRKVEQKVEKEVEKRIVESIEEGIEDGMESDDEGDNSEDGNDLNSAISRRIMSGLSNAKYDQSYTFGAKMSVYIENTNIVEGKQDVSKGYFNTYFDKGTKNYALEIESADFENDNDAGLLIFDFKNGSLLIMSDDGGDKSGIAITIAKDSTVVTVEEETKDEVAMAEEDLVAMNYYYKATGRSKNILGYKCEEYQYQRSANDSIDIKIWASRDIKLDYSQAYTYMGLGILTGYTTGCNLLGTVLEMHLVDLRDDSKSDMTVKEIDEKANKTFNLSGYQIMGMGGTKENE